MTSEGYMSVKEISQEINVPTTEIYKRINRKDIRTKISVLPRKKVANEMFYCCQAIQIIKDVCSNYIPKHKRHSSFQKLQTTNIFSNIVSTETTTQIEETIPQVKSHTKQYFEITAEEFKDFCCPKTESKKQEVGLWSGRHCAVYKYVYEKEIIYIGKSDANLMSRIRQHSKESKFSKYLQNVKIFYAWLPNPAFTTILETYLINKHKPKLNQSFKYDTPLYFDIPEPYWYDFDMLDVGASKYYEDGTLKYWQSIDDVVDEVMVLDKKQTFIDNIMHIRKIRDQLIDKIDVLDNLELNFIPCFDCLTTTQIREYFNISSRTMNSYCQYYSSELKLDGISTICPKDIFKKIDEISKYCKRCDWKSGRMILTLKNNKTIIIPNVGIRIFSKRAILRLAMLLKESKEANDIRLKLLQYQNQFM